jgi:hypothetical protein
MYTWIIEHIIGSIPVWVWTFVAGAGAAAYFLSGIIAKIPTPYTKTLSIVTKYSGMFALLFGIFMCGGAGVTAVLQKQIKEANARVERAEAESKKVNTVIREKVVTQIQIVKEKTNANNQAIETKRDSINAECKLSDDAWMLYNQSTKNAVAPGSGRARSTSK